MEPRLYIVMREDLPDMNPGKGMAQAAHAQADFNAYDQPGIEDDYWKMIKLWQEDRTFGVTLVLSTTLEKMKEIQSTVKHSGLTVDPTYPWRNWYGKLFTTNEVTCMWAFVWEEGELEYMRQYDLHK
jgi:hypothetical protein